MEVNPFASSGTLPVAGADFSLTGGQQLGQDEFLQMLVTQLTNQDPLNPLEGHEFAAQLAQFSSVEALINIENSLATNTEMNGLMAQTISSGIATGLIGQEVEAFGDGVHWPGEGEVPLVFELAGPAASVTLTLRDADGTVTRTIELDNYDGGKHTFEWDGTDGNGATVGAGSYTLEATALDEQGIALETATYTKGTVDRVTFGEEGILLWFGETSVLLPAVISVGDDGRDE